MKKLIAICILASLAMVPASCTNMNRTEQGTLTGAAGGALAGAGISKLSGGSGGTGALIGGALGGVIGAIYGSSEDAREREAYHRGYVAPGE